ncbi:Dihydrofolate reductase [Acropora cervicornis]|uniref:dihydrofolate reductase n=1 Tax=Acropora cervicornis TaxID=6130 RepID=A0AAD9R5H5_ACRCE|nr:Dihydrofolate reductase [Acropora cervicornis]
MSQQLRSVSCVAAMASNRGIGNKGKLPWPSLRTPPRGSHHVCDSVLSAVKMLSAPPFSSTVEEVFVLGGTEVYREAIESSFCHRIYLTEIDKEFDADAFFPTFDKSRYKLISNPSDVPEGVIEENGVQYRICVYERKV